MIKITARTGQTLADLAIQAKGTIEALVDMAQINNMSLTSVLAAGMSLKIPDKNYNPTLNSYVKSRGISPATAGDYVALTPVRVFTEQFTNEFI